MRRTCEEHDVVFVWSGGEFVDVVHRETQQTFSHWRVSGHVAEAAGPPAYSHFDEECRAWCRLHVVNCRVSR